MQIGRTEPVGAAGKCAHCCRHRHAGPLISIVLISIGLVRAGGGSCTVPGWLEMIFSSLLLLLMYELPMALLANAMT